VAVVPASAGTELAAPEAAFEQRSYAPGATAQLIVWHGSAQTVRIHRVGDLGGAAARRDPLAGSPALIREIQRYLVLVEALRADGRRPPLDQGGKRDG